MSTVKRVDRGKGHSYYLLNDDGSRSKLDGVTTLLGDGLAKPALINWAGNTTASYAVDHWDELADMPVSQRLTALKGARFADRDTAAARGTQVHELAERVMHGLEVEVPDELRGHVESAARWMDEFEIEPIITETVVWNGTAGYAGTLDMVVKSGKFPGQVWLADYKTNRSGLFSEAALQLAAYANAEFYKQGDEDIPMSNLGVTHAYGIHVRADGYSVRPLDISDRSFETFRYITAVARRARAMKENPLVGDELLLEEVA